MVDVTSLHIGISINAINSCRAAAISPSLGPALAPSLPHHSFGQARQQPDVIQELTERFLHFCLRGSASLLSLDRKQKCREIGHKQVAIYKEISWPCVISQVSLI